MNATPNRGAAALMAAIARGAQPKRAKGAGELPSPLIMAHAVAGFPNLERSAQILRVLGRQADIVELQIPFSDPVADGPVLANANATALANGFRVRDTLDLAKDFHVEFPQTPLVLMGYANTFYALAEKAASGRNPLQDFFETAANCGVAGLIIPDLPPEEDDWGAGIFRAAAKAGIAPIPVVTPMTNAERLAQLAEFMPESAGGMWYLASRTGVTGARKDFDPGQLPAAVRAVSPLPRALAFGISSAQHVATISAHAEVAVLGSAIAQHFVEKGDFNAQLKAMEAFVRELRPS